MKREKAHRKRRKNYTILQILREKGPMSRYDLAKATGYSPGAINPEVDRLVEAGYLVELGPGRSNGGRPPTFLNLNPRFGYVLGLDFHGYEIMAVLVDFAGEVREQIEETLEPAEGKKKVVSKLFKTIRKLLGVSGMDDGKVLGIGVAVPGTLDSKTGVSLFYPGIEDWRDVPLRDLISMEFDKPTFVEQNIRAMTLAEKYWGQGKRVENFLCVGVRSGIGMGIVIGGELYRGKRGMAGELGHITIDRNGPRCRCGNRGCLEALASGRAILERGKRLLQEETNSLLKKWVGEGVENLTIDMVVRAGRENDPLALDLLREMGEYLGIGVANIINILNPELVIIGGPFGEAGEAILTPLRQSLYKRIPGVADNQTGIVLSTLGKFGGARGATTLIFDQDFYVKG